MNANRASIDARAMSHRGIHGITSTPLRKAADRHFRGFDKGSITVPEGAKTDELRSIVLCNFNQLWFRRSLSLVDCTYVSISRLLERFLRPSQSAGRLTGKFSIKTW